MNVDIIRSGDRGHFDHGWLSTYHSFSFADYYNPDRMGFSTLRVINEDRVAPGQGFGTDAHRDMEIVSYVLSGELAHKDSTGVGSVIKPGEVQRMSAGKGVRHSEFNNSPDTVAHFLQIWITPAQKGIEPSYEQKAFADAEKRGRLRLINSPDATDGSVTIHTDARVYAGLFDGSGEQQTLSLAPGRSAYVHVVPGQLVVNGRQLAGGDAMSMSPSGSGAEAVTVDVGEVLEAEVLVFDLP